MKRVIIILLSVIILLGAVWCIMRKNSQNQPDKELALSFDAEEVKEIRVKDIDDEFVWINENGEWKISGVSEEINAVAVEQYMYEILNIQGRQIEKNITNPEEYGLNIPQKELEFLFYNGDKKSIKLGNLTPSGTEYYMSDDKNNLYVIYTSSGSEIKKRATDFYDSEICSISYNSIVKISVYGDTEFELDNNGSEVWTYTRNGARIVLDTEKVKINVTKNFNRMYALDIYEKTEEKISEIRTYKEPVRVKFRLADGSEKQFTVYGVTDDFCFFTVDDGKYLYKATSNYFDFINEDLSAHR